MKKSQIAKQQRNEQMVKTIIEATRPLILSEGYDSLTIRDICANAGITTGMFYRHFVSKDDVLSFCYMQELEVVMAECDQELEGLALPDQIVHLVANIFRINKKYGPESVYMFINRNTESTSGSFKMRYMLRDKIIGLIQTAVDNGYKLHTERNPYEIFCDISTIMKGLTSDWYMVGETDLIEHATDLLGRLLPALL